jgi:hypothetical protein
MTTTSSAPLSLKCWRQAQIMERARRHRVDKAKRARAARASRTFFDLLKATFSPPQRLGVPREKLN